MLQDSIVIEKRHKKFIKTVCKSGIVYGLKNEDGFATSSSVQYEDENEEPIGLICFWAEKAFAKSCIKDDWDEYLITEIQLSDFMENWCVGMRNDGLLVGTEFDQNMFGYESEPLELVLDLILELKNLGRELEFQKFNGLDDFAEQIKAVVG